MRFLEKHKVQTIIGLILFFILLSMSPTFYEWSVRGKTRPERYFELVHNFPTDYNLYLSRIRQGKEGSWLAHEKYTSEPHAGSLSQILYVIIGRLAHFSHIQTPYVWFAYHVARAFFSALLLWVVWKVVEWAFATQPFAWRLLGFLLVVTASTWPKFEWVRGVPRFGGYMAWYTQIDSLQRTTFMPHVMLAQTLMVFIIWVLSGGFIRSASSGQAQKHPGNWVFLGIVGIVLGIVFPPGLFFIYGVLGIVTIGEALVVIRGKKKQALIEHLKEWFVSNLSGRIIFGLLTIPTMVYFALLLREYPWKRLVEFDVLHPTTNFAYWEYFMALGATLPFGLLGLVTVVFGKNKELFNRLRLFVVWVVAWLFFLFLFSKIPQQSPTRFTQMAPHIPLGIFTAYFFWRLVTFLQGQKKQLAKKIPLAAHKVVLIAPILFVVLGLGSMASSFMWIKDFVDHKLRATIPLVPHGAEVMYPMRDIIDGLIWLQVYTPRDSVVASGLTTGNYIPVYAGNTAYVGHANTVRMEEKMAIIGNFYRKHLSLEEELSWLDSANISYVFYGPEEREINGGLDDLRQLYPTLELVFQNPTAKIYKAP